MAKGKKRINKKGSILDVFRIGVMLLVFAVGILMSYKVMDEVNSKFQNNPTLDKMVGANDSKDAMNKVTSYFPGVIDNSFLFLTIGLVIVALILAMLVRVHPVFFVFYFVFMVFFVFLSGIFSNIYQGMADTATMSEVAANLTFTSHILEFLPFIVGIVGFLIALVMYKTYESGQG